MKALRIDRHDHSEIVDLGLPELKQDELLIKVMASGICGTDIHIFRGDYMGGYPIVPGHEFSGIVESIGTDVQRFRIGDRVAVEPNISCDACYNCLNNHQNFCENWQAIGVTLNGGMAEFAVVPEKAAFDIEELPFEHAAFMEPLSCVVHGAERLGIGISDRVAILGLGPIGILFSQIVRLQGATHVTALEKQPSRAESAKKCDVDRIVNDLADLDENSFDIIIDTTGAAPVMERSVDLARHGGKVLLFGVPPASSKMIIAGLKLFQKGLSLISSFTSVRNSYQAVSLLQSKKIDVSDLVTHALPLSEFERGVELIEGGLDNVKKVMVLPHMP